MNVNFDDPVKQEIWTTVRAMNDAWTAGNPDGLAAFFHDNMVAMTATDRNRLDGGAACIAGWKTFCEGTRIHRWQEINPLIHVYGDSAVVAYYYEISFESDGRMVHAAGRDMFFFVKDAGRWWAVADHFSPYPAS